MGKDGGGLSSFLLAGGDYGLLTQLCREKFGEDDFASVLTQYLHREKKLFDYLSHLVKIELSTETKSTLFRETSIVTWLFVTATNLPPCVAFLKKCVGKTTKRVRALKYPLEVDPVRMNNLDLTDVQRATALERNPVTLQKCLDSFMSDVVSAVKNSLPTYLRKFFAFVLLHVGEHFPEMDNAIAGNFLFLRWICPSLIINCQGDRSAILLCKMAQAVANGAGFGEKETYMIRFNEDVRRHINETLPSILLIFRKGGSKLSTAKGALAPSVEVSAESPPLSSEECEARLPANPLDWECIHFDNWLLSELGRDSLTIEECGLHRLSVPGSDIATLDRTQLRVLGVAKIGHQVRIMTLVRDKLHPTIKAFSSEPDSTHLTTPLMSTHSALSATSIPTTSPGRTRAASTGRLKSRRSLPANTTFGGEARAKANSIGARTSCEARLSSPTDAHGSRTGGFSYSGGDQPHSSVRTLEEGDGSSSDDSGQSPKIKRRRSVRLLSNLWKTAALVEEPEEESQLVADEEEEQPASPRSDLLPLSAWSVDTVSESLRALGLDEELIERLAEGGLDGSKLCGSGTSHSSLAELGVRRVGQRIHILRMVAAGCE